MRQRHWSHQGEKNRMFVLLRDGRQCQIAGVGCLGAADSVDHIIPKSLGGPDLVENLRACCKVCNSRKGRQATEAAERPFFRDGGYRRAPLRNTPLPTRWRPLTAADYRKSG